MKRKGSLINYPIDLIPQLKQKEKEEEKER